MKLYRYRKINQHTLDSILKNELWFSTPQSFNDPYEFIHAITLNSTDQDWQAFLLKFLKSRYPGAEDDYIEQLPEFENTIREVRSNPERMPRFLSATENKMRSTLGVCCFSARNDSILMWSHYADKHSGICLEFDTSINPKDFEDRIFEVKYCSAYTELNIRDIDYSELARRMVSSKSDQWEYEQEYRILSFTPGAVPYVNSSLTGIVFGCRCSDTDRQSVMNTLNQKASTPKLFNAVQAPNRFEILIQQFT